MSDIFISYASVDRPKARQLAAALEHRGWLVWWDREILPGSKFSQMIDEKLNIAKCMLVLWSKASVASDWVEAEAAEGKKRGILVPVLVDNTDPGMIPLEFRRFEAAQLANWDGSSPHEEFELLLRAIAQHVGAPTATTERKTTKGQERVAERDMIHERKTRPWWTRFFFEFRTRHFVLSVFAAFSIAFIFFVGVLRPRVEAPPQTNRPSHVRPQQQPFFMTRLVTEEDLQGKNKWELDVMRNEIYARHGRRFNRADLQQYFNSQPWYFPRYAPDQFSESLLSDVQAKNAAFIQGYQRRRGLS